jgi:predicted dinucleotide-binding enzyme
MNRNIELLCLAVLSAMPVQVAGQAKPTVAIIGTGDMGDSLGPKIAALGYPVVYGSRDPSRESVRMLVQRTGEKASAASQRDAAAGAHIVILAVQWPPMEQVAKNLGDLKGKIVVDVSYPVRRGADGYMEQSVEPSAGELIQSWNPAAKVVKVGIPSAYIVDDPMTLGMTPTVPIAANDREAKETVANLIAGMGLDPWDAGPLRFSRSIESFGLLFWVPLQQGRKEGIEIKFIRSSYWPCVWDVVKELGPTADSANLARFPEREAPRSCDSYKPR